MYKKCHAKVANEFGCFGTNSAKKLLLIMSQLIEQNLEFKLLLTLKITRTNTVKETRKQYRVYQSKQNQLTMHSN